MIQLLLSKTAPHFQLLPMSKVDQSLLRIHEVPPLQKPKSHMILQSCWSSGNLSTVVGSFCGEDLIISQHKMGKTTFNALLMDIIEKS